MYHVHIKVYHFLLCSSFTCCTPRCSRLHIFPSNFSLQLCFLHCFPLKRAYHSFWSFCYSLHGVVLWVLFHAFIFFHFVCNGVQMLHILLKLLLAKCIRGLFFFLCERSHARNLFNVCVSLSFALFHSCHLPLCTIIHEKVAKLCVLPMYLLNDFCFVSSLSIANSIHNN